MTKLKTSRKKPSTFAQQRQLENLTAGALLELGNAFSGRGDLKKAEYYFNLAIQFAQANKGRVREARGLSNLGGLYIQTLRIDQGLQMVQQAMDFFQRGNYPRSVALCLTSDRARLSPERRLSRRRANPESETGVR